jgi:2-dehydro-3-deoxyphosphogluconate aldolase / (4S)-4-hydroxy-2-oxoglutarate aldolase
VTAAVRSREMAVSRLREVGIIPVLRADSRDTAIRVAETLADAGLGAIEVTMTVPDAIDAIAAIVRRLGGRALVGAGTVTDADSAQRAIDAGAEFLVSPGLVLDVIDVAKRNDVAVLPGALTPTEILGAVRAGADMVKIFPASSVGGAAYIRTLRAPFPDVAFVPTGGVTLQTIGDFIRAGSAAVGVGGELLPRDALARGDFAQITALAKQFISAVKVARGR